MRLSPLFAVALAACGTASPPPADPPAPARLAVDVFAAEESDVNAFVLSDGAGTVIIDATRSGAEAREVLALARARGGDPGVVFVTHGHPDHFLGLGALVAELPDLRVVVATEAIKADIVGMATWMEGAGWLDGEPGMKPRTAANPTGFDYDRIEVLAEPRLVMPGGAVLEIRSDYPAAEAAHTSTLYSPDLGALFASDLAYHDVHLWLGVGVMPDHARAWQAITAELERTLPPGTRIYPGHGAPTDASVFAANRAYIDDLLDVAATAPSDDDGIAAMAARYPDHANREFLLLMSIQNQRQQAGR